MKLRLGFISNSSSTAFILTNKTKEDKTIVDFVKENPQLIEQFKEEYDWHKEDPEYTQENMIKCADTLLDKKDYTYKPGSQYIVFGDENGYLVDRVFDYILREGGESENFKWRFKEQK